MAYEKPLHSLNRVDKAGRSLTSGFSGATDDLAAAVGESFSVMLNHRASHSYPLNALHMTLRNRARSIDPVASTGQRLKRLDSILRKLRRNSSMQLSQMQDVGGCRAIVDSIESLHDLVDHYGRNPLQHELSHSKNYVDLPKGDGYRGVHLMYRYHGRASSSPWDKLRIELQLRTRLQHAWATAVETVDAFTGEMLKFGGGRENWRRFFLLARQRHTRFLRVPRYQQTSPTTYLRFATSSSLSRSRWMWSRSYNRFRVLQATCKEINTVRTFGTYSNSSPTMQKWS
ncbi:RelA/SpoT domain-containing protein [Mesorhizobium sp. LMG 17147]|uniref:RelA/SpoT domain-containing protein n=1 Tax=Mesorhizobium sp. LMG 17147 TaxID=2963091 RepID=UPI0034A4F2C9